jgi:hypothetical protein
MLSGSIRFPHSLVPDLLIFSGLAGAGSVSAATHDYFRFEDGAPGAPLNSAINQGTNNVAGSIQSGQPHYGLSVPLPVVPRTGADNTGSLSVSSTDALLFSPGFLFDTEPFATLEFWVKPAVAGGESDIFWTSPSSTDINRFNIGIFDDSISQNLPFIDYRDSAGTTHVLGNSQVSIPAGEWSFVAYVKSRDTYSIYINSSTTQGKTVLVSRVTDGNPMLPMSAQWTVNGRPGFGFTGELDEIRISDKALKPAQFLVNGP